MRKHLSCLLTSVVVGAAGQAALGDVLVDNLDQPTRDATFLGTVSPDDLWAAQAFSGAVRYRLDSIEVLLGNAGEAPDAVMELHSGSDPTGPLVATFMVPALPAGGAEVVTLTPQGPVVLEPGVTYWLVMGTVSTGGFSWSYAEGNDASGSGSFLSYMYSQDQGVTWGFENVENPYQMRVTVSAACAIDLNGDGVVNVQDFLAFLALYSAGDAIADTNGDGEVNVQDFLAFLALYALGC
jgi:hypothetical protein